MPYSPVAVRDSSVSGRSRRHRCKPTIWTREKIYKLIELYRASDCLWNHYSELYKNKDCRTKAVDQICASLGITKDAYGKKVHNLRNQFNSELKKYERRLKETGGKAGACRWEHFETLMFLRPIIEPRPGYQPQCKKTLRNWNTSDNSQPESQSENFKIDVTDVLRVESASDSLKDKLNYGVEATKSNEVLNICPLEASSNSPNLAYLGKITDENTSGSSQSNAVRDQWDAFGELIANEFRNLNSAVSRKILKRKIMQVMLEVGEEDDKKYISLN